MSPGDDRLRGDGGHDQLDGGDDNDTLDGSGEGDNLLGGLGSDTLRGGAGDQDFLDGGKGDDMLNGGAGAHDVVNYDLRTAYVGVTLAQPNTSVSTRNGEIGENDQITQVEDARGSQGPDLLIGNEGDNYLTAFVGGDSTLIGRAGADHLVGAEGSDFLHAGDAYLGGDEFFVDDGAFDVLDGLGGDDQCFFSTTDPDSAYHCE